jgi:hypothetical protein
MNLEKIKISGLLPNYSFFREKSSPNRVSILASSLGGTTLVSEAIRYQKERINCPGFVTLKDGRHFLLGEEVGIESLKENLAVELEYEHEVILDHSAYNYTPRPPLQKPVKIGPHPDHRKFNINHVRNLDLNTQANPVAFREDQEEALDKVMDRMMQCLEKGLAPDLSQVEIRDSARGGLTIALSLTADQTFDDHFYARFGIAVCSPLDNFNRKIGARLAVEKAVEIRPQKARLTKGKEDWKGGDEGILLKLLDLQGNLSGSVKFKIPRQFLLKSGNHYFLKGKGKGLVFVNLFSEILDALSASKLSDPKHARIQKIAIFNVIRQGEKGLFKKTTDVDPSDPQVV